MLPRGQAPVNYRETQVHSAVTSPLEPKTYKGAMRGAEAKEWLVAIDSELASLKSHCTYSYLPKPPGVKVLPVKFVLKLKLHHDGTVDRYKARLVALGFMQQVGRDCGETYTPVSRYSTMRFLIAHCNAMHIEITHRDVKTAFLNADLEEEVWISDPPGVEVIPCHAYKMHKALYGLKQAPRAWAQKLRETLLRIGYVQSTSDQCTYVMSPTGGQKVWCNTYVDDLFLGINPGPMKDSIITELFATFEMKNLGILTRPLGMELIYDKVKGTCTLHWAALIRDLISDNGLLDANPRILPIDPSEKFFPTPLTEPPVPKEECNYLGIVGSLLHLISA
jgi:hypothetical protein